MQPVFLRELLDACGRLDLHRAVDTCGHVAGEVLLEIAERTELFLFDLKHMDREVHERYTGVGNEQILENLRALSSRDAAIRIRFPVIPGVNDDRANLERTAIFLLGLPRLSVVDLLAYHDVATSKYGRFGHRSRLDGLRAPEAEHLNDIAGILGSYGLCVNIGGTPYERAHPKAQAGEP